MRGHSSDEANSLLTASNDKTITLVMIYIALFNPIPCASHKSLDNGAYGGQNIYEFLKRTIDTSWRPTTDACRHHSETSLKL